MASIGITASIKIGCSSQHIAKKPPTQKQATNVVATNVQHLILEEKPDNSASGNPKVIKGETENSDEQSRKKFSDERWKNGTWDLNMFVKNGRMDWDSVIVAEAKRRKYLEIYPEGSSNEEAVMFRSSIIPWWAWILQSHLPEAELLNGLTLVHLTLVALLIHYCLRPHTGRAAMVGFFTAYLVDALTGLDMVGQTGNFVCKAALFFTIIVVLFTRKEDVENINKLADEATYYDKQWQASWKKNPEATTTANLKDE